MKKILSLSVLFCCFFCYSQTWDSLIFNNDVPGLNSNPIRGLIPSDEVNGARNFPYSMEFFYLPLRGTMLNINSFDWTALENKLNDVASRGNTAVFRFYMDYPGRSTGVPQFLIDAGVTMTPYSGSGNSRIPDYDDPLCMQALTNFIENLGIKYNGDPRISIIQAGLYGFWGEMHHYIAPPNSTPPGADMTQANLQIFYNKFVSSFTTTKINFRGVVGGLPVSELLKVGYHDDSFMYETLGPASWQFWPRLINAGVTDFWRNHPMGGEMRPEVQNSAFASIPNPIIIPDPNNSLETLNTQDFEACVNTTHATYMYNYEIWQHAVGSTKYNNAIIQNKKFGYKFYVNGVKLNASQNGTIDLDVRIENRGVAPFYYNWNVEFALLKDNKTIPLGTTDWNIKAIQPNDVVIKNYAVNKALLTGSYTILMRFVNPLTATRPNAKQLHFANAEQNADKNGWLTLKTFNVGNVQPWEPLTYNANQPNLELNPLKGLATMFNLEGGYTPATAFPHSIRGKLFGLDDIMTGMNTFDWSVVDNFLLAEAAKGNHSYIQVNIDPAFGNSDMPSFLATQVDFYDYIAPNNLTVSDKCPNWNDPELMTAMENFIAAFGARYNNDQRVFLVHLGLYGMWGEWHIGETENFRPEFEMSPNNKKRIANAYKLAFPNKQLLARYPENMPDPQIYGYSDGLFFGQSISDTKPKYFHNILKTAKADENWKLHPIGGEVSPAVQPTVFDVIPNVLNDNDTDIIPNVQSVSESLNKIHPTWLFIHHMFKDVVANSQEWNNAIQIQKDLGYTFYLEKARISAQSGIPTIEVNIQNKGIAPMYANWDVEIGVLNSSNVFQSLGTKKWDMNLIQPLEKFNYRSLLSNLSLADGSYKFLIRIINPLQPNASQTKPVRFANTTQDQDINGWLTLGLATISSGATGITPIKVTGISVSPSNTVLNKNDSLQIIESIVPLNATNTAITWVSDHPGTAAVDQSGFVTVGTVYGKAKISAYTQDGGFVGTSQIEVLPPTVILPSKIEAENFITMSGVQIYGGDEKRIGNITANDWVEYNVTVTESTDFTLDVRYGIVWNGARIKLVNDDNQVLTTMVLDYTGGNTTFNTKTSSFFTLPAGRYNLRIEFIDGNYDIDWIQFKTVQTTYRPIPALLEAESFDLMNGFVVGPCSEGGQNLGYTDGGDWAEYFVKVDKASIFTLDSRLAGTYTGSLSLLNQNNEVLTTIQTPNTNDWQIYTTIPSKMFVLPAGNQRLKIRVNNNGFNLNWIQFKLLTPLTFCTETSVGTAVGSSSLKFYTAPTGGLALDNSVMLVSGTYYTTETISGVESARKEVTIVIDSVLIPPTATSQTFCNKTKFDDLIAIATGTLKWYANETGGVAFLKTANVTTGNYYVSQTTLANCESGRTLVAITVNTTTWSNNAWSNGAPDATKGAIIAGNYSEAINLTACSLEITGSATVSVPSGFDCVVSGKITVASTASLTFENNANLLQTTDIANFGKATIKRNTTMQRLAYTMWSSPVADQNALAFSPLTVANRFYSYAEATNTFVEVTTPSTTNFAVAKGYAVRAPNTFPASSTAQFVGTFSGTPNNGNYTFFGSKATDGYNLIGNPYPSTLYVPAFFAANSNVDALYFWDNSNLGVTGNRYATKNAFLSVASALSPTKAPTDFIGVGQGFYVRITSATNTNIVFTNAMRSSENEPVFFRNATSNKSLFKLNLLNPTNNFNQIAIGYLNGATNGVDNQIDAVPFAQSPTMVSSLINNNYFVIQGRALPFANTDIVPLGFKTDVAGIYSFATEAFEGVFANNQNIFIKDNLVGIIHNIKQNPYQFSTNVGTFNNRFEIVYQSNLSIENPNFNDNNVFVFVKNDNININSGNVKMKNVQVFDIRGRLVFDKKEVNATQFEIENLKVEQAVLIVKITSEDGAIVTKKIVY